MFRKANKSPRLTWPRLTYSPPPFPRFNMLRKGTNSYVESSWNVMAHDDAGEGKWRGKLANGVGSQYSSHYLGTWCIQHYYRWCAHLGCQYSTELTPPGRFKWTRPFLRKTKSGFCACAITFQTQSTIFKCLRFAEPYDQKNRIDEVVEIRKQSALEEA